MSEPEGSPNNTIYATYTFESEAAELARLLAAMEAGGKTVSLWWNWNTEGVWHCSWRITAHGCVGTVGATPAEAVRACWERGQA